MSKSEVSRVCGELDERVGQFRDRAMREDAHVANQHPEPRLERLVADLTERARAPFLT